MTDDVSTQLEPNLTHSLLQYPMYPYTVNTKSVKVRSNEDVVYIILYYYRNKTIWWAHYALELYDGSISICICICRELLLRFPRWPSDRSVLEPGAGLLLCQADSEAGQEVVLVHSEDQTPPLLLPPPPPHLQLRPPLPLVIERHHRHAGETCYVMFRWL